MFNLDPHISRYPGFPKDGITFYDIAPMLEDRSSLKACTETIIDIAKPYRPDLIAGIDARGFLFVTPVALATDAGIVLVRKSGKLPGAVIDEAYDLEYGQGVLSLQQEREIEGKKIIIVDDLLATGGTLEAATKLIARRGGSLVANIVLIELTGLKGREKLRGDVHALQQYEF